MIKVCRRFFKSFSNPRKPPLAVDCLQFWWFPNVKLAKARLGLHEVSMKNYTVLFEMKSELKKLIPQIRAGSARASFEFRHLHVARCLIKGRTLTEIEGPDLDHKKTGNRLDQKYLGRLLDHWRPKHEAEVKAQEARYQASRAMAEIAV